MTSPSVLFHTRILYKTRRSRCVAAAFLALFGAIMVSLASAQGVGARRAVDRHLPGVAQGLPAVNSVAAEKRLQLALGLPLRNQGELNALLERLYDPASPNYRAFLTPEEFTKRFGPTEADYQRVVDFAKQHGFTITATHPNRVLLDVNASAAQVEAAFNTKLRVYHHPREQRDFFAPDREPSVESSVPIMEVRGLDDYSIPRPRSRFAAPNTANRGTPNAGSAPFGAYRGKDFRAAYAPGVALTGSGQYIGLLQFDGYYPNDITNYEAQAGLPNVPITTVPVNNPSATPGSGNSEVALDIEMAISMAPGISGVIVYQAPNPSPWEDILNVMANQNAARQLSCSWGGGGPNAVAEQIFQQMAAQGQSFFNASGDNDAFSGAIDFPSESPNITQVGGTTLTTGPGASYDSETVWNQSSEGQGVGSGGGISPTYSIPVWQQGIDMTANQGSTTNRNIPDVALTADNVWVNYNNGQAAAFGGTSCAAPLWAGFTALVNQQAATNGVAPVGFLNPAIYAIGKGGNYSTSFHDVTTGNNVSATSSNKFPAAAGYDLCTGWGTPMAGLIAALTGPPAPQPNLTPYQPSGWSDKIVVSTTTGTNTDSTGLQPTDTLYVDWALINNGTASVNASFVVELYVDDVLRSSSTINPPVDVNDTRASEDFNIGSLVAGVHKVRIKVDAANSVSESNESDNEYTKSIVVGNPPLPNLTPYKPSGWSDKIVIAKTSGTTTGANTFQPSDKLYLDWAIINNGTVSTSSTYTAALYVDNVVRAKWTVSAPSNVGAYRYIQDYALGTLTVGQHSIRILADSDNSIAESNEKDNDYTATVTISDKFTVTTTASPTTGGSTTGAGSYSAGSTVTVTATANAGFTFNSWTENGTIVSTSTSYSFLVSSNRALVANFTKPVAPNLAPYAPSGWSAPIVVSNITGTSIDTAYLKPGDSLYVDWAVINNGNATANTNYSVELYVDGMFKTSWTVYAPSNMGAYRYIKDYNIGSLGLGDHKIEIRADATNTVGESNETDNNYTKTITIANPVNYTISVSASPALGGTVTGGGSFVAGTKRTVTATAKSGYGFVSWSENGTVVSTSASYSFTVTGNRTLIANFKKK